MASMQNNSWTAYFSKSQPPPPRPSLMHIIYGLKKRELTSPIFVCLQCTKESSTQQAMAAHCRWHVRYGMVKGTVEHIKYFPDHTYTFLCPNRQPSLPASGSSTAQILEQQPNMNNEVQLASTPISSDPILPYAGTPFISLLARSMFINGPTQDLINRIDMLPSLGDFQQYVGTEAGGSTSNGFDITMSQNHNGGGPSITPNAVTPDLDLTLRLNSNPRPDDDDATMHGMS